MDVIIEQYFDLNIISDNFSRRPRGLLADAPALGDRRRAVAGLGAGPGPAAPDSGQGDGAGPRPGDRLHRRLPRHPAAAGPAAGLGQLRGARGRGRDSGDRSGSPDGSGSPTRSGTGSSRSRSPTAPTWPRSTGPGSRRCPSGQMEAARSLGMSHGQAMRQVIVPQAVRKVIPPLLNDFIALMKDTSLVSVIGFVEVVQVGPRRPVGDLQQLGADPGGDLLPAGHDPAGAAGRPADRPPAGAHLAERRRSRPEPHRRRRRRPGRPEGRSDGRADAEAGGGDEELRRPPGAARDRPRGRPRRGRLRARPERLGQEHAAALHQPARAARGGRDLARGQGDLHGPSAGEGEAGVDFVRQRVGMVFQQFNLFPHKTRDRERLAGPADGAQPRRGRGADEGGGAAEPGRARRQARRVPGAALGRPAAAGGDRPGAGDGPARDALRRGDQRARPGAGQGGARRDARARRGGDDDDRRHPRDRLRPRRRRPGRLHGRGRGRRARDCRRTCSTTRRRSAPSASSGWS